MATGECSKSDQIIKKLKPIPLQGDISDVLSNNFASLSITVKHSSLNNSPSYIRTSGNKSRNPERISPSEFFTLQRLRSSALACKTSTTIKTSRNNGILLEDLINNDAAEKNKEKYVKNGTSKADGRGEAHLSEKAVAASVSRSLSKGGGKDAESMVRKTKEPLTEESMVLLARGPVRNLRSTTLGHVPYTSRNAHATVTTNLSGKPENYNISYHTDQYGLETPTFSSLIEGGSDFTKFLSNSSTLDTVQSDLSCDSSGTQYQISSNLEQSISSPKNVADNTQLPEDLSDFILKYSHEYTTAVHSPESGISIRSRDSSISDGNIQSNFDSPLYRILVEDNCVSPLSAKSAPQCSPVLPRTATQIPVIFEEKQLKTTVPSKNLSSLELVITSQSIRERAIPRLAKSRLRALINDSEMVEAWAWTCKCIQELKGALCYQDPDGDSLLHIVILHMDLAKIYALVEQMLKAEDACTRRAFDMPNRAFETPLYLAVQKNSLEVVAYLMEAGANPNYQTASPGLQTPLHCAASNGMTDIVEILCASGKVDVNTPNGMGQTPLLCAVKENGVGAKKALHVDNGSTILCLLKYGANPMNTDLHGNNILHYAVNSLDADLIEMFKSCVDEETITKLANKENMCGETPLESLHCEPESHDERLRSNVFISLLRCGATVKSH